MSAFSQAQAQTEETLRQEINAMKAELAQAQESTLAEKRYKSVLRQKLAARMIAAQNAGFSCQLKIADSSIIGLLYEAFKEDTTGRLANAFYRELPTASRIMSNLGFKIATREIDLNSIHDINFFHALSGTAFYTEGSNTTHQIQLANTYMARRLDKSGTDSKFILNDTGVAEFRRNGQSIVIQLISRAKGKTVTLELNLEDLKKSFPSNFIVTLKRRNELQPEKYDGQLITSESDPCLLSRTN